MGEGIGGSTVITGRHLGHGGAEAHAGLIMVVKESTAAEWGPCHGGKSELLGLIECAIMDGRDAERAEFQLVGDERTIHECAQGGKLRG